jgi:predicted transcriptional regulator
MLFEKLWTEKMAKKREKLEIIRDILLAIRLKNKIKPTQLLHSSNLSPQMFKEYVGMLLHKKFIEEVIIKNKKIFALTSKGNGFLEEYRTIENFIRDFGL